jgi:hypothetical protein
MKKSGVVFSLLAFLQRRQGFFSIVVALSILLAGSITFAAITVGSSTTGVSDHVKYTNLTLTTPASIPAGTLMLASIVINGGSTVGITAPAGWVQIARTDNDVNASLVTYWKVAGSSEPSNYTWVLDTQTRAVGGITPYSGIDATNPIDTSSSNSGFSNSATTTSITTAAANEEVIALFGTDVNKPFGTPVGMTQEYSQSNGAASPTITADDAVQTLASSSGSKIASIDPKKSRYWVAQQIALRPSLPTLTNNIVSYWKLDGNSSDAVGANNGIDSNVTYGASYGKINQGAAFDGSTSYINSNLSLSPRQSYSVSAWVNLSAAPTITGDVIFSSWDTSPKIFVMYIDSVGLHMQTGSNPIDYTHTFLAGTWYLVTATSNWNGTNYVNNLYLNGTNVGSNSSGSSFGSGSLNSYIGTMLYAGTPGAFFQGDIDEVGVWNRALTATEVSQLYNAGMDEQYPF